jgi:hypothetical protein
MTERPHFIVHEPGNTVDVVVVEDAKAGQELSGRVMATDATVSVRARGRWLNNRVEQDHEGRWARVIG